VSFAAITLCVALQRVFILVSIYFVIDSVRKLMDTPSYVFTRFLATSICEGVSNFFDFDMVSECS
jgi:hypothetical protein